MRFRRHFFHQYESGMCLKYSISRYQNSVAAAAPSSTRALILATSRRARFCLRLKKRLIISAASAKKKKIRKSLPIISGSGKPSEKYGSCAADEGQTRPAACPAVSKSHTVCDIITLFAAFVGTGYESKCLGGHCNAPKNSV